MTELNLRPTTEDDLAACAGWELDPDTATWLGETGSSGHERSLADHAQEHLLAHRATSSGGTEPVGFAVLAGLSSGVIEIRRMLIRRDHRGHQLGRQLLRAVVERARRTHQAHRIWLDVRPHNLRAQSLYRSEGFVVVDGHDLPALDTGGDDLVIMELRQEPRAAGTGRA